MTNRTTHRLLLVTEDSALKAKVEALCSSVSTDQYHIEIHNPPLNQLSCESRLCDAVLIADDKKELLLEKNLPSVECAIIYLQQHINGDNSVLDKRIEETIDMNKITKTGFLRAVTSAIEKCYIKKELNDQKKILSQLIHSTKGVLDSSTPNDISTENLIEQNRHLIETVQKQNEELKTLSRIDALTKINNRLSFEENLARMISHAKRHKHILALLMIDLDKFKNVNDTYGHQMGDLLLQAATQRLQEVLRKDDFIARLGGDEFAIILNEIESAHAAGIVSWKITQAISKSFIINRTEINIDISVGIACYPLIGEAAEDLIKHADIAMYQAKKSRTQKYTFASLDAQQDYLKKIKLAKELKDAIQRNELHMVYQPIYEIPSRRLHGFEALIRWENKHLGKVSPAEFIPIAEDSGLIHPISNWVLDSVCKQISLWQQSQLQSGRISMNLSPAQLLEENLSETIKNTLEKYHLSLDSIEFELTEMAAIQENEVANTTMKNLRELGVSHALDNFGTGYSSMQYLKYLPVTTIKIAQSFTRGLGVHKTDEKIIASIIALGRKMGLRVVAEGVETEKQLTLLIKEQCDYAQGFLFSKPLSVEQAGELIRHKNTEKK